ncbi:DUF2165 domain-containing protein [Amycolatopsis cihanbeyliensis]|uniref:Putative small integral membrane protein n=1 Tax=Amycolatopsis cihanbeyliensis TaxID=1128664 RepID=A0A542DCX0_AMYCI|nr:DUF2165 domain-containing protein [Amycolatopsis cihanbeyliensis]TQJ00919.1 putative small integral membrane protein [Amycolatopsis cihanbeyliensis]
MRLLARLGSLHMVVAVLSAITGLYMGMVVLNNLTDFGTNQAFVRHVLAMDTTFESPNLMWRAITDPTLADIAYFAIIVWEALTAVALLGGFIAWVRALAGRTGTDTARRLSTLGWLMQVLLFGGGFLAIGGEWFQMWQSADWNGMDAAMRNVLLASVGIILAHLPNRETAPIEAGNRH